MNCITHKQINSDHFANKYPFQHEGNDHVVDSKKVLSQESSGAWIEEKDGKKRYFVDDSGWFQTSFKQVSKEEFLQGEDSSSTIQKVIGIGLGILALLPGALEIRERLPFGASEAGLGLLAFQQKSPLLGALGFSLLPSCVEAQAVGTEFLVNNFTREGQNTPAIAALNDGGFVVTWDSWTQDGDSDGVFAQRYEASGALFGAEFQVNNYTTADQYNPAITPLNDGGFVIAWQSFFQDGDQLGVFGQRYDASGALFDSEFRVNNYTSYNQQYPVIAPLNDGGFVIAWESNRQDGDQEGIFAQRYDATGAIVGSEFQVNNYTISGQLVPAIAPLNDGGFVVAWESKGQDGDFEGIFAQRYDVTGALLGAEFQVNNFTVSYQENPAIAPLNDGGFVVVWQSNGQDGDSYGIFGQRYDAAGALYNSEFQVNNFTASDQSSPAIAPLNDGGFVISWESFGQDGSEYGIFARRFDSAGTTVGPEFQVNNYTTGNQYRSAIASLNDGGFVVTWESNLQDGNSGGIFGQRYDQGGNPVQLTYVPSMSSISARSSNADSTTARILSSTASNSLQASTVSSTASSIIPTPAVEPFSQVRSSVTASTSSQVISSTNVELSSGLSTTISQLGSIGLSTTEGSITNTRSSSFSTSGVQTASQADSSSSSGLQIPILVNIVYGESYSITLSGQTIGTFSISGGTGQFSSSNPNTLNIELDPNIVLQDGDTLTLFSVPEGEEIQWEGVNLDSECFSSEGETVFNEETLQNDYQLIFNLDADSCIYTAGALRFGTVQVLAGGGLI